MKFLLVLAALAAVAFADVENNEIDLVRDDGTIGAQPQFIISWQVRKMLKEMRNQMPCGWPNQGIPPLAPFTKEEIQLNLQYAIIESLNEVFRFRLDGLDNFKIKTMKLNIITSKIKFHFLFKNIRARGQYSTNTVIDMLKQMGLRVRYEGNGDLDFGLENLSISGTLKYKLPILWGSIKITQFYALVTLGDCNSNITGIAGNGKWNRFINDKIEDFVVSGINENTDAISNALEAALVPRVNKMLKGNDFWTVWDMIFNSTPSDTPATVCVPVDPWA